MKYQLFLTLPFIVKVIILTPLVALLVSLYFGAAQYVPLNIFLFLYMFDKETEIQKLKIMNFAMTATIVELLKGDVDNG